MKSIRYVFIMVFVFTLSIKLHPTVYVAHSVCAKKTFVHFKYENECKLKVRKLTKYEILLGIYSYEQKTTSLKKMCEEDIAQKEIYVLHISISETNICSRSNNINTK